MPRWEPNPGPQSDFLATRCFEALYGGAAGGGKSEALLVYPLQFIQHPAFSALILRRTFPELERTLIKRSRTYYGNRATYKGDTHVWKFPSGAEIGFGYLEHEDDVEQYQSAEFQFIGFDELTHFTEHQYRYMLSRLRGPVEIPKIVRGGTNPGSVGHDWVEKRWGAWVQPEDWKGPTADPGRVLYFKPREDEDGEDVVERGTPGAFGRTFIPALLKDNPKGDPRYGERLALLDIVTRRQLRDGDWRVRPAAGLYFNRGWWQFCNAPDVPKKARRVRLWDLASTKPNPANPNPDWTIGTLLTRAFDGRLFVENSVRMRDTPGQVRAAVRSTAELDRLQYGPVESWIFQDPAQAGKDQVESYAGMMDGFAFHSRRATTDKVTAAGPWSSSVEHKRVWIVRDDDLNEERKWVRAFCDIHEAFPTKGVHDDDVDSASGAHAVLCGDESDIEHTRRLLKLGSK